MVKVIRQGVYYMEGWLVKEAQAFMTSEKKARAVQNTMTHALLAAPRGASIAVAGDVVSLLRALDDLGCTALPAPAVFFADPYTGAAFQRSAAERYGARLVCADLASPQQYLREEVVKSGERVMTDRKLPCGALGALSLPCGEGGILRYAVSGSAVAAPVVAVLLRGVPKEGVGPTDLALAMRRALRSFGGFGAGKILEFFGAGLGKLSMDFRNALSDALAEDCLATLWATDARTEEYFAQHGREGYAALSPTAPAYYEGGIVVDLSRIEPMIGFADDILPVRELLEDPEAALRRAEEALGALGFADLAQFAEHGKVRLAYGEVGGYAGTFETVAECAERLKDRRIAPAGGMISCVSAPVARAAMESGYAAQIVDAGMCFERLCDWSVRGLFAADGDLEAPVVLDARTIAASLTEGELIPATQTAASFRRKKEHYCGACYESCVLKGSGNKELPLDASDGVLPIPALAPVPDSVVLTVAEEDLPEGGAFAVRYTAEEYEWGDAIAWRERGAVAAIAVSYSEEERIHLIDWGILPLTAKRLPEAGTVLRLENIHAALSGGELRATRVSARAEKAVPLTLAVREGEREVLLAGSRNALCKAGRNAQ